MPSITIRRVPLRSTREYGAPPKGFPRVRMTPNGVQMLAAVNGRGAYDKNGPKKQRRKARKKAAKARSYSSKARRKGISATTRAKYRRKARKATKKAKKRREKAEYQSYVKKMARKAGLTRKELIRLLRGEGMTKADATCVADGGKCATGTMARSHDLRRLNKEASMILSGFDWKDLAPKGSAFNPNEKAEIYFDNRKRKEDTMAGRKRKRKAGRKAARRGTRRAARRTSRRSRSSSRRRSSGRRRSSKRSRKGSAGSSKRRRSGRRGMRRNGSDDFEMNGSDDFEANGFEMNGSDDFEANPYHENGYEYEANKKKGKRKSPSKASKFNRKLLKETGLLRDFGPEPVAGMMIDTLASRLRNGEISLETYKQLRKQVAKHYFPKQEGRGGKIGVTVTDPITGKSKTVKVPWKGKVRTAFGPYKRRQKGGMYTYEWEKGEKIPEWALAGAFSKYEGQVLSQFDPDFAGKYSAAEGRILEARMRVAAAERAELERKIAKLQEKQASGKVEDPMTPNKRGSGRRRGKRRMSAAQKKALVARLQAGKRAAAKRRGGKRSGRKSGRRKARRGSSRRKARRGGKRRGSSRRKARRGKRRSSRRGKRRGRKGFRKNFSVGEFDMKELGVGILAGGIGVYLLQKFVSPMIVEASPAMLPYAPLLVGAVGALVTSLAGQNVSEGKDFINASALGMLFGGGVLTMGSVLPRFGFNGIPYVNTSGWGARRPVGAYELRGYELRGMGAYPQQALAGGGYAQALAAYELRGGMGAYPQQALAGGYAQALAGQPYDQELMPSQADAALDWADQESGGEYVNSQLQPTPPLFIQDSLSNLGVPGDMGGGIPTRSIWNPTGEGFVDATASVGGNFDDPNV